MFFAIFVLLSFVILAVAALRWGQDSRDNSHSMKVSNHKHHAII
jgi:hypothetical protein